MPAKDSLQEVALKSLTKAFSSAASTVSNLAYNLTHVNEYNEIFCTLSHSICLNGSTVVVVLLGYRNGWEAWFVDQEDEIQRIFSVRGDKVVRYDIT